MFSQNPTKKHTSKGNCPLSPELNELRRGDRLDLEGEFLTPLMNFRSKFYSIKR